MIAYLLLFIAAFFNACMDAFENENFYESIFKSWNVKFWYKRESWKYAKKIGGYKIDAWHISKTLMLLFLAGYAILLKDDSWWLTLLYFGIVWNGGFVIFYHYLFKIK